MSRLGVGIYRRVALESFQLLTTAASRFALPSEVDWSDAVPASAPGTVAGALAARGALELGAPPPLDACDHWYRTTLPEPPGPGAQVLGFEGLATIVEVWLDNAPLLRSDNMFVGHELEVSGRVRGGSELVLCFRALAPVLAQRRPRPRWRTRLVESQQLRWVRTSLLGRTPGFCPRVPVVGPYRPVWLEARPRLTVRAARVWTELCERSDTSLAGASARFDEADSERGLVHVELSLSALGGEAPPARAELFVEGAAGTGRMSLSGDRTGSDVRFAGTLALDAVAAWWPHTHGAQPRSRARIVLAEERPRARERNDAEARPGAREGNDEDGVELSLGQLAFRRLAVDRDSDGRGFGLCLNGVPVFARGACWTTDDLLALSSASLRHTLTLVRDAGMNMLRIAGTNAYECDAFYELCDELGILVFQEFMFANMDYPAEDPGFLASVEREARELLGRIGARPCLALLGGGSEVAQQIAMLGLPRELSASPLFDQLLPRLTSELAPGVPYVPTSPVGGELPFQVDEGLSHYYGVGAYLRPLEDARRARVRFASECLAFANVPSSETIESFLGDLEVPFHHPRWKERVPRDRGAGWDFEDVRDHYVRLLFGSEPRELRYADPERYLALSRAAVGEGMTAAFHEWRRTGSSCRGALVFWLKDFWAGAGWGVLDARSQPKSAYYYLKRCLAPLSLACTDEGLNGLAFHASHDAEVPVDAELELAMYQAGEVRVAEARRALRLAPRSTTEIRAEALLGRFVDATYAYRFGPPGHDLTVAWLRVGERVVARAFHLPLGHQRSVERELGLKARAQRREGNPGLLVTTDRFAQCVTVDVRGYLPVDDFFHLEPAAERWIELRPIGSDAPIRGSVGALNARSRAAITAEASADASERKVALGGGHS